MSANLLFDFTADKANNSILVTREFTARQSLVWDAFTKPELLDQWGAPGPWKAHTIYMELKVGGRRFYKMVGPEGQEHYSVQDFTTITPRSNLQYISGFSDKDETIDPEFYGSQNNLDFSEVNGITTVRMSIKYKSADILAMMIEKGFKEGLTMTLELLDTMLTGLSRK